MLSYICLAGFSCRLHPWPGCQQEKSGGGKMSQGTTRLKLLAGDANCEPLGKQGAFSVG